MQSHKYLGKFTLLFLVQISIAALLFHILRFSLVENSIQSSLQNCNLVPTISVTWALLSFTISLILGFEKSSSRFYKSILLIWDLALSYALWSAISWWLVS